MVDVLCCKQHKTCLQHKHQSILPTPRHGIDRCTCVCIKQVHYTCLRAYLRAFHKHIDPFTACQIRQWNQIGKPLLVASGQIRAEPAHASPIWTQISSFSCSFGQKMGLRPVMLGLCPLIWKILDPPLVALIFAEF